MNEQKLKLLRGVVMKKLQKSVLPLILLSFIFVGCTNGGNVGKVQEPDQPKAGQEQAEPVKLTVSAAASLTDCLEELKELYINENPNVEITYNFGSSGSLQQQIEQGAPADIFFSAGKKQMTALKDAGLMVDDSVKDILENKVALITPLDGKQINSIEELTDDKIERIAVGEPESVPVGQYTDEALKNLNVFDSIESKLVFAKDVREVLSWVETGNVDAGFVYQTDAKVSDKVKIVLNAPEGSHKPVIYPVGVVKSSKVTESAQDFVDFLFEEDAKNVFIKYGFSPIS